MPKLIDYAGRFAFFEEACFAIVRDHGVEELSRNRLAATLGSSSTTVRRLVNRRADLRRLALEEVRQRRVRGRYRPRELNGVDGAVAVLRRLLPDSTSRIAEELVWWRVAIAAPTTASIPPDEVEVDEGPLRHRFAVASHGFVPEEVLVEEVPLPRPARDDEGVLDPVVRAVLDRHEEVGAEVGRTLHQLMPDLRPDDLERAVAELHALLDGLGLGVCLGRLRPEDAVATLRGYLVSLG